MTDRTTSFFARPGSVMLLATFCCLLWGSAYLAIKQGYALFHIASGDVPAQMLFAGLRFTAAGVILLVAARLIGWKIELPQREWLPVGMLGLTQTAIQYVFFYIGLAFATGTKSSIMNATGTFFSVLLAHFLYHNDRLSQRCVIGCSVGFLGVAAANYGPTLLQPDFTLAGEGSVVLAAFILSAATIYGKMISQRINAIVMTGWQMSFGGLVLTAVGLITGGRMQGFTPTSLALLGYMAVLSSLAFGLWSALLKYHPVGKVAVYNFLIPVFGVALSAIFLGEAIFAWKNAVALVLVCAGIWLVTAERPKTSG
ncbi:MAG: EamA family transporter [Candidatus Dactylopiibacterium carminicum]|uniref:EamA family transporter n=1 Tax=Candidatus Dactylopiibacterium carminicum TaxID=857335 RepID=A0A272EMV5_9RHOO|nr:DMT family transporter [Candidatus Dactylopiibacterium carminicum]KAF7597806.1 EamA/RhaT family transporter [Candidatus Dactylopiibacterium carminicum]PAS91406.1 MAG: EamA family transporter [Candidatus Dactylopiibacterium carminicum]PAS92531.1 MAG: EamA family transporter [Candidatus Dactylopiibacterium carminicum]PAS95599.1 MAG: EamA family transporter [Candidatus Dactylopiibacterium carminicum]